MTSPARHLASRPSFYLLIALLAASAFLLLADSSSAAPKPAVLTFKTVKVGAPGNPSVGIVPFTDAIYRLLRRSARTKKGLPGGRRGRVPLRHRPARGHGRPVGRVPQHGRSRGPQQPQPLQRRPRARTAWPKYGQIDFAAERRHGAPLLGRLAGMGRQALRLRQLPARGPLRQLALQRPAALQAGAAAKAASATSPTGCGSRARPRRGMYDMTQRAATTRSHKTGFVVPSQDEWIKAAYYDPSGGGTYSYWKYPTNPGVFGEGSATAPQPTTLDPTHRRRHQRLDAAAGDLPRARKRRRRPGARRPFSAEACATVNPFGIDPTTYAKAYQGSLSTVGQAQTTSPWGTLDQGGNAVEWTDTITPPPFGQERRPGLAAPARRHRQRPRLPALALGGRPAAAGQHLLHRHLPVARVPRSACSAT